jgi:ribose transport system substrate-binding protein
MLFIGQGIIQIVTGGYPVYPLPPLIDEIGRAQWLGGLGWSFFFFVVAAAFGDFVLRHAVIGRNMYVTGGNPEVAQLVGISTRRYKITAFVLVGALSAVAGMFVMADLASATTGIGSGWELAVIAGVVVGGVSLFGGTGTIVGGLIGILLLQVVQSGLVIVGVSANWQQITVGIIMILAVGLDTLRRRLAAESAHAADVARSSTKSTHGKLWRRWAVGALAVTAIGALAFAVKQPAVERSNASRSLLFVQPLRDHPVCKIMAAGFLNRCQELGYHCEVVGNASATNLDVAATIPLAEAALARRDFGAVGVFALDTSIYPFIQRLSEEKLPVVTWHVLPEQGTVRGLVAATGQDIAQVGEEAGIAMGERLGGRGVVAITQGSFNTEENTKAAAFRSALAMRYPGIIVLEPQLEGFEPTAAKSKAISILQGNTAVNAVLSTTVHVAQNCAGAARAAGREVVIIGMDYIRANLDLVKTGEVYGIVAQPLYEEGAKTADLLAALTRGEKVPYRNPLPAKVITASDVEPYYAFLQKAQQ